MAKCTVMMQNLDDAKLSMHLLKIHT